MNSVSSPLQSDSLAAHRFAATSGRTSSLWLLYLLVLYESLSGCVCGGWAPFKKGILMTLAALCAHLRVEITSLSWYSRYSQSAWTHSVTISLWTNRKHTTAPTKDAHSLNHNTIVMDVGSEKILAVCSKNIIYRRKVCCSCCCFPRWMWCLVFGFSRYATCTRVQFMHVFMSYHL